MSQVPAKIRTTPARSRWPNAASVAAMNVNTNPTTVTWFGVSGTRPAAAITASARRRTQASNRVVNMSLPWLARSFVRGLACFFVDLDHLRRDSVPRVAPRFVVPVRSHPASQLGVPGQDDQRRTQLGPALGPHRKAVVPRLEHRHVPRNLGRDDRQPRRHGFQEDDAEALGAGGGSAKDVGAAVVARLDRVGNVTRPHDIGKPVAGVVRPDLAPEWASR